VLKNKDLITPFLGLWQGEWPTSWLAWCLWTWLLLGLTTSARESTFVMLHSNIIFL
jgi:hypothetical protein